MYMCSYILGPVQEWEPESEWRTDGEEPGVPEDETRLQHALQWKVCSLFIYTLAIAILVEQSHL